MAARGRFLTEWVAREVIQTSASPASEEADVLTSATDFLPPATLIRTIGSVIVSITRSAIISTSSSASEGAHVRLGILVEETPEAVGAGNLDLSNDDVLSDDRWLWVNQCRLDSPAIGYSYWNGSAQVDRYAITPDFRATHLPVDIRAKRRWVDPCRVSVHMTWTSIGTAPSACTARWQLRHLFKMP